MKFHGVRFFNRREKWEKNNAEVMITDFREISVKDVKNITAL